MNDLMTNSFLSYVELKKQALKDHEARSDLEMGHQSDPVDEENLSNFFQQVAPIKTDMEEITNLLLNLQDLNEETKSTHSAKILRGIRDRIKSDMVTVLRKANDIKSRLTSLDKSNIENQNISLAACNETNPIDRTRVLVTNGLRHKLREMMQDFQSLREQIVKDHKDRLKRRYYNATGEEPSEEMIEKMILGSWDGQDQKVVFEGKEDLLMETQERQEALKEIQRSLTELHHVFLDMAVLVETQGEKINDIEENVVKAFGHINGGTRSLFYAQQMKKKRRNWACLIGALIIFLLFVCLISTLVF